MVSAGKLAYAYGPIRDEEEILKDGNFFIIRPKIVIYLTQLCSMFVLICCDIMSLSFAFFN